MIRDICQQPWDAEHILMKNINGEPGCKGRGNIAPITINLPRIGIEAKGDIDKFFEILKSRLILAKESLLHRYDVLKKLRVKDLTFCCRSKAYEGFRKSRTR